MLCGEMLQAGAFGLGGYTGVTSTLLSLCCPYREPAGSSIGNVSHHWREMLEEFCNSFKPAMIFAWFGGHQS
jgi:hypothetical protein